jgi:uncharacterized phage protein (TIGR01671 family)
MATMIKFRAWDKRIEAYLYNVQNAYDTLSGFVKYDDGEDADYDEDCFGAFLNNKRYDVEQFTGLKDVNGNEIYIGDIVKYRNLDEKYQYLKIRWLQQDCMIDAGGYRIDIVARRCEVIGNVHTNPELLEDEK